VQVSIMVTVSGKEYDRVQAASRAAGHRQPRHWLEELLKDAVREYERELAEGEAEKPRTQAAHDYIKAMRDFEDQYSPIEPKGVETKNG
jgi:hypothetical protein